MPLTGRGSGFEAAISHKKHHPRDRAQALVFRRTVEHPEMADDVVVSLETGMRQGEALNLAWTSLDDRFNRLDGAHCRSGIEPAVPIIPEACEVLERLRRATGRARPEPILGFDKPHVRHEWNRRAGALQHDFEPDFVVHIMRHGFGSRLADRDRRQGDPDGDGHSSITTTQRYIHMSPTALEAPMAAMTLEFVQCARLVAEPAPELCHMPR